MPKVAGGFVFPGAKEGQTLSTMALLQLLRGMDGNGYTVHGFRSSFRDWAGERSNYPRDVIEMALAHVVASKTEAAYRRGDALEKRRRLMDEWSRYCMFKQNVETVRALNRSLNTKVWDCAPADKSFEAMRHRTRSSAEPR